MHKIVNVKVKLALSFLPVSKADVHADIASISIQTAAKKSKYIKEEILF